jgi:hypothetical protein
VRHPTPSAWAYDLAASAEHAEKACRWLEQMTRRHRGECLQPRGRWLLSGVSQCKLDRSEIYFAARRGTDRAARACAD